MNTRLGIGAAGSRALGLAVALLVACEGGEPGHEHVATPPAALRPPPVTAALENRGTKIFEQRCTVCHGAEGRGDGPAAYLLEPRPRDFVGSLFRLVSTANGPQLADLFRTITRGMPGSAMPPWSQLPEADRWAVAAAVLKLSREGQRKDLLARGIEKSEVDDIVAENTTPGDPIPVPPEPEPSLESLERGRMLYLQTCAPCHDADGRGRLRRDLEDSRGFPIFARDFTRGVFKGSPEADRIALRMLAGIPGTPMPSYATDLSDPEDLWAVVHYVRSLVPEAAQERVVQKKRTIRAVRVEGPLVADPDAKAWEQAEPAYIALMPLRWQPDRTEGLLVRVLHDGTRIAVRITWADATEDRLALRTQDFADAVAVQLSLLEDPPLFAMGAAQGQVAIWHWKAFWQADLEGHRDVEAVYPRVAVDPHPGEDYFPARASGNPAAASERRTSVENLVARGFGTLTPVPPVEQNVRGAARWDRGVWDVVLLRDLAPQGGQTALSPGGRASIGFAAWDGSLHDRDGQKAVTIWHELVLDR